MGATVSFPLWPTFYSRWAWSSCSWLKSSQVLMLPVHRCWNSFNQQAALLFLQILHMNIVHFSRHFSRLQRSPQTPCHTPCTSPSRLPCHTSPRSLRAIPVRWHRWPRWRGARSWKVKWPKMRAWSQSRTPHPKNPKIESWWAWRLVMSWMAMRPTACCCASCHLTSWPGFWWQLWRCWCLAGSWVKKTKFNLHEYQMFL